jgi:predicted Holliday junction resolvase-like endonuclease
MPYLIIFALMILCVVLLRKIIIQEVKINDLDERLNLSDEEYINLYDVNLGLSDELDNFAKTRNSETWYNDEIEKRMNIIGQNGNDGTHYEN